MKSNEKGPNPDWGNQKETGRIETFSDGVFCIAITLLTLELGLEFNSEETNLGLLKGIWHLWPKYLAYFLSFVNVLLAWIGHHAIFRYFRNTDNLVMICNGFLLLLVAMVPFPARVLGQYMLSDAFQAAVMFYTGYFVLISIAFRLLWYAAVRNKDYLLQNLSAGGIRKITFNENTGLVSNLLIFLAAFVFPWLALLLSFVMWVYWLWIAGNDKVNWLSFPRRIWCRLCNSI